jgi:ribosomal small subunit protein bTHX
MRKTGPDSRALPPVGPGKLVSYAPPQELRLSGAGEFKKDIGVIQMGRGDRKTRKGKIAIRSYGNVRLHKTTGAPGAAAKKAAPAKPAVAKKAAPVKKAAPAKKAG